MTKAEAIAKEIDELFSYHTPGSEQSRRIANIRMAAKAFANTILENCPDSMDRDYAIRMLRTSSYFANSSIVLE